MDEESKKYTSTEEFEKTLKTGSFTTLKTNVAAGDSKVVDIVDGDNVTETETKTTKHAIIAIYSLGICIALANNYFVYTKNKHLKTVFIVTTLVTVLVLALNGYFSSFDKVHGHKEELGLYSYVENNGRVFLTASLAMIFFIDILFRCTNSGKNVIDFNVVLLPIILSFLYSVLILVIVWMPKHHGVYIRILRDVKTVFLTNSIANICLAMLILLNNFL